MSELPRTFWIGKNKGEEYILFTTEIQAANWLSSNPKGSLWQIEPSNFVELELTFSLRPKLAFTTSSVTLFDRPMPEEDGQTW